MRRSYLLQVWTPDNNAVTDKLIAACPLEIDSSGIDTGRAFIRFRAESDETAREAAAMIRTEKDYLLSTGYGVHLRIVEDSR